jgi:hypothetical protein
MLYLFIALYMYFKKIAFFSCEHVSTLNLVALGMNSYIFKLLTIKHLIATKNHFEPISIRNELDLFRTKTWY